MNIVQEPEMQTRRGKELQWGVGTLKLLAVSMQFWNQGIGIFDTDWLKI